ncbi:hypothetical protein R1X32_07935 (plasmid) [Rhodococcus opacus]|uniref:hypothetical protein n=1 Tax=Rhodococcus opacus TaxID=37919 RepID=UPI0002F557FF|nr:hypothetical protein [Rhodococcus opacus]MDV7088840.1 hypothetical protein [Rhodococcus opacus]WKN60073.1 hypothetical protein HJ581_0040355 [Rhodococcus opacus]
MAGGGMYAGVVVAATGVVDGAAGATATDDVADAATEAERAIGRRTQISAASGPLRGPRW